MYRMLAREPKGLRPKQRSAAQAACFFTGEPSRGVCLVVARQTRSAGRTVVIRRLVPVRMLVGLQLVQGATLVADGNKWHAPRDAVLQY